MTTTTLLTNVDEEVLCTASEVQSGDRIFFLGTNKGNIYRYNLTTGVKTLLTGPLAYMITSMDIYSGKLYVGLDNGDFYSITT